MSFPSTTAREHSPRSVRIGAWHIFMILVAVGFSPLILWLNAGERPMIGSLIGIWAGLSVVGVASLMILARRGLDPTGLAYSISIALFIFGNTATVITLLPQGRWVVTVLGAVMTLIAYRIRSLRLFQFLMTWAVFFALGVPLITGVTQAVGNGPSIINPSQAPASVVVDTRRDVIVIVLDAYTNEDVLSDLYGYDNSSFIEERRDKGFSVEEGVTANYGHTQLSVSTVLQLDYVAESGSLTDSDIATLLDVMSGENRLAETFTSQGYRHIYVESGWLGTICGSSVDVCVEAPWPDESFWDVANRSMLVGLPGLEPGRSFDRGAAHVMDWIDDDLESYLEDGVADYIYVHLLAPHPPLTRSSDCSPRADPLWGFVIGSPTMSEEQRTVARQAYVDQLQCVNSTLLSIASMVDDEIVLMFGDHGPDSLGQLYQRSSQWDGAQIRERLGSFVATRAPGCDMAGIGSLVNLGRRLVRCVGGTHLADLPTKTFDVDVADGSRVVELETPIFGGDT